MTATGSQLSTFALRTLVNFVKQYQEKQAAEKLASERAEAAFGKPTEIDLSFVAQPNGAGK